MGEMVEDSFDKIEEQYFENWQLFVMRESVQKKRRRNLLEKWIVTNKCLLREKDNILNLLERESVCKKIEICWWIKMRV